MLSTDPAFFRRMESLYAGRDFRCDDPEDVHHHGVTAIRSGRGAVLVVDLTNRCNVKCSPCFMDANHAPYVHELPIDEIRHILDRARSLKPQRDFNVLFSGGEPTVAHRFLDAVRYARSIGFQRLCVATNGIRFAEEEGFAEEAHAAGLHQVYLQLDGTSNEQHQHRGASNLFDVKRHALQRIARAGMKTNLQVTVMNGVNNHAVGDIVRFAVDNIDKVRSVLFQPIMFTGRDSGASEDIRRARRYTLADLPRDLQQQFGTCDWEPMRDWFPMSVYSVFGRLFDALHPDASRGSLYADVHPNQGIISPLLVNQATKQVVPISSFVDVEGLLRDIRQLADQGRSATLIKAQLTLAVLRRFDPRRAPEGLTIADLRAILERFAPRFRSDGSNWSAEDNTDPQWRLLMIAAMWFQDLFNYDFSVIGMDAARTATFPGEISFCAYNAGGVAAGDGARLPDRVTCGVAPFPRSTPNLRKRRVHPRVHTQGGEPAAAARVKLTEPPTPAAPRDDSTGVLRRVRGLAFIGATGKTELGTRGRRGHEQEVACSFHSAATAVASAARGGWSSKTDAPLAAYRKGGR